MLQVEELAFHSGSCIRIIIGVLEYYDESRVSFEVCTSIVFIEVWFELVSYRLGEV